MEALNDNIFCVQGYIGQYNKEDIFRKKRILCSVLCSERRCFEQCRGGYTE